MELSHSSSLPERPHISILQAHLQAHLQAQLIARFCPVSCMDHLYQICRTKKLDSLRYETGAGKCN